MCANESHAVGQLERRQPRRRSTGSDVGALYVEKRQSQDAWPILVIQGRLLTAVDLPR